MLRLAISHIVAVGLFCIAASANSAPDKCPNGIGAEAGDAPKIVMNNADGTSLIVCGWAEKTQGKTQFSEFDIYPRSRNRKVGESLFRVGAVSNYWITESNNKLTLEELAFVDQKWLSVFKFDFIYESEKVSRSKELCVFKKPKVTSKMKLIRPNMSDSEIDKIAALAYSGNPNAQDVFLKETGNLDLDGHAAETYSSHAELIRRLKKAKCL